MLNGGFHCCCYVEPLDEPPVRLRAAVERAGLDPEAFVTLQHGAMIQTAGGKVLNKLATLPLPAVKRAAER